VHSLVHVLAIWVWFDVVGWYMCKLPDPMTAKPHSVVTANHDMHSAWALKSQHQESAFLLCLLKSGGAW
jgi:hypothetical protein